MAPKHALAAALGLQAVSMAVARPHSTEDSSDIFIVGGQPAHTAEFPSIVSLGSRRYGGHFCGGTLLNARTVVTAAHCSVDMEPSVIQVRAGTNVSHFASPDFFNLGENMVLSVTAPDSLRTSGRNSKLTAHRDRLLAVSMLVFRRSLSIPTMFRPTAVEMTLPSGTSQPQLRNPRPLPTPTCPKRAKILLSTAQ